MQGLEPPTLASITFRIAEPAGAEETTTSPLATNAITHAVKTTAQDTPAQHKQQVTSTTLGIKAALSTETAFTGRKKAAEATEVGKPALPKPKPEGASL